MAKLNITFNGQNGDYPDDIDSSLLDEAIKNIATEGIRTGYVPGINPAEANFTHFVIDRFSSVGELPDRIILRPKAEYGR